jgi:hypothetical protein
MMNGMHPCLTNITKAPGDITLGREKVFPRSAHEMKMCYQMTNPPLSTLSLKQSSTDASRCNRIVHITENIDFLTWCFNKQPMRMPDAPISDVIGAA